MIESVHPRELPAAVTLVEVGPRDGLQNESQTIALQAKLTLIDELADAGHTVIEAGSFVNPKWVPQMADSEAVFNGIERRDGVRYTALTPNLRGFERACEAGADEVAIFAAASEAFSRKNINCSIADSLQRFAEVMAAAKEHAIPVRGYVSCVLGCPMRVISTRRRSLMSPDNCLTWAATKSLWETQSAPGQQAACSDCWTCY